MLEAIRTSRDGMVDKVLGNIIAESRKRVTFGGLVSRRGSCFFAGMWNRVEYVLKDSKKAVGQLEVCSDSKEMQSVLN